MTRRQKGYLVVLLVSHALFSISAWCQEFAFVTQVDGGTVSVIDLDSNTVIREIQAGEGNAPRPIAANSSGSRIAIGVHGPLFSNEKYLIVAKFLNTPSEEIARIPLPFFPSEIVFSPLGGRLYVAGAIDSRTHIISMSSFSLEILDTFTVSASPSLPSGMAISPEGSQVFVAIADTLGPPQLLRLDVTTDAFELSGVGELERVPGDGDIVVSRDGLSVWITNDDSNTLTEYDTSTLESTGGAVLGFGFNEPKALALSPDGERLYVSSVDCLSGAGGTVFVFNRYGVQVGKFGTGEVDRPLGIALNRDGSVLYVANQNANTVSRFSTETNDLIGSVGVPGGPTFIAIAGPASGLATLDIPTLGGIGLGILASVLATFSCSAIRRRRAPS